MSFEALKEDVDTATAFDLNYRSKLWSRSTAKSTYEVLLPKVDLLFAPERDAQSILDGTGEAIADELRTRFDCETVVVTRGADGAIASIAEGSASQSAFDTETLDPIGTGDAFVGTFLSRYVRDASVSEALTRAAATAALKRTIKGGLTVITEDEVEAVIAEGGSEIDR
ncbi:PfkB family carbohydrate kinase [Haloterrigena turkmenica]|uniref:PfkB family carbohydrate kinase n=1 Tax=Haloterrigena turkmenica TaxID=62320 RepID=UPI000AE32E5E|nr:PfkB family carbohydrate kinase [Haloterrigena turkmenica]